MSGPPAAPGKRKPRWLSLICTKVNPSTGRACASPIAKPRGTPPETVQAMPVPAQARHLRKPRRLVSAGWEVVLSLLMTALSVREYGLWAETRSGALPVTAW